MLRFKELFLLFIFLSASRLFAAQIEARVAGFLPESKLFRDMYGTIIPSYQIEAAWPIKGGIQVWSNVTYFNTTGHSTLLKVKTRLQILPVSAGLKYVYPLPKYFSAYAGVGASGAWIKETNHSHYIPRSNSTFSPGGIFKLGITMKYKRLINSIFVDYLLQESKAKNSTGSQKVNTSGFFFGGSIGVFY